MRLSVSDDVCCYAACDFRSFFVLSKIFHKLPIRVHQVHDNGVVHLQGDGMGYIVELLADATCVYEGRRRA